MIIVDGWIVLLFAVGDNKLLVAHTGDFLFTF